MIGQILAHLWGDYLFQSDWMALNKRKAFWPCFCHCWLYTICFIPVRPPHGFDWKGATCLSLILWSHFFIDRYGLARYIVYAKNFLAPKGSCSYEGPCLGKTLFFECRYFPWSRCSATGYDDARPMWLTVWLLIIADNTLHLTCNYLALKYFGA